jgi:hypothetical protein
MSLFDNIIAWSEVWALLIPLAIIIAFKPGGAYTWILITYVVLAFLLNVTITISAQFNHLMPSWLKNNNILYNIHSVLRVIMFTLYIVNVRLAKWKTIFYGLLALYLAFVIINFSLLSTPFLLNTRLFSVESVVLLVVCLAYFFHSIQDESETNWLRHPSFLVCAAIIIYEGITFFIFLFFYPLHTKDPEFAVATMTIYAITFVIFCILLAMALYKSRRKPVVARTT